jgi:hypothetical protein
MKTTVFSKSWPNSIIGSLLILMTSFSVLLSCSSPQSSLPEIVKFDDIRGIVFDATAVRLADSSSFQGIAGIQSLIFNGDANSGHFTISYSNYREPKLCTYGQECLCTGILKGEYYLAKDPSLGSSSGGPSTVQPYNPNTPSPTPEPTIADDTTLTNLYLKLIIDAQNTNLSPGCPIQADRTVKLEVHNDMRVVMTDLGKNTLFVPRKTN